MADRPIAVVDATRRDRERQQEIMDRSIKDGRNIVLLALDLEGFPFEQLHENNYHTVACIMGTPHDLGFATMLMRSDAQSFRNPGNRAPPLSHKQHELISADWVRAADYIETNFLFNEIAVMRQDGTATYTNTLKSSYDPERGWQARPRAVAAMLREQIRGPNEKEMSIFKKFEESNSKRISDEKKFWNEEFDKRIKEPHRLGSLAIEVDAEFIIRSELSRIIKRGGLEDKFDYDANTPAPNDEIFDQARSWSKDLETRAKRIKELNKPAGVPENYDVETDTGGHFKYISDEVHRMSSEAMFRANDRRTAFKDIGRRFRESVIQRSAGGSSQETRSSGTRQRNSPVQSAGGPHTADVLPSEGSPSTRASNPSPPVGSDLPLDRPDAQNASQREPRTDMARLRGLDERPSRSR
jgi:hypothetical protein